MSSPYALPAGPTRRADSSTSIPPPEPRSSTVSPSCEVGDRSGVAAAEARRDRVGGQRRAVGVGVEVAAEGAVASAVAARARPAAGRTAATAGLLGATAQRRRGVLRADLVADAVGVGRASPAPLSTSSVAAAASDASRRRSPGTDRRELRPTRGCRPARRRGRWCVKPSRREVRLGRGRQQVGVRRAPRGGAGEALGDQRAPRRPRPRACRRRPRPSAATRRRRIARCRPRRRWPRRRARRRTRRAPRAHRRAGDPAATSSCSIASTSAATAGSIASRSHRRSSIQDAS